jgi:hypothetical protein
MYDPGMFWAAFGAAWVFGCAMLCIVIWSLRSKANMEKLRIAHEERMKAMEKGIPLPEFPDLKNGDSRIEITPIRVNPRWPLGLGAVFVLLGLGFIAAMMLSSDAELFGLWSLGLLGIFFGVGLMLYYLLTRQSEPR